MNGYHKNYNTNKIKGFFFKQFAYIIYKFPILFKHINQEWFIQTIITKLSYKFSQNHNGKVNFMTLKKWLLYSKIDEQYFITLFRMLIDSIAMSYESLMKSNLIHEFFIPHFSQIVSTDLRYSYVLIHLLAIIDKVTDEEFNIIVRLMIDNQHLFSICYNNLKKITTQKQADKLIFYKEILNIAVI